jgi:DNA-binding transcriptional MocR family regulator
MDAKCNARQGEIDITSGAIDAIERLLCAHLLPGDSVVVEDPCFLAASTCCAMPDSPPPGQR